MGPVGSAGADAEIADAKAAAKQFVGLTNESRDRIALVGYDTDSRFVRVGYQRYFSADHAALNATIGYDQAAKVAKKAAAEGRSVRDVLEEMDLIPADEIDAVLDVRSMTEPGIPGQ